MYLDGYLAFMLVATALVLMMTVPALALFYGGMTRSKSVLNMMMMSFVGFCVAGIVFVLWGWSMGWGGDGVPNLDGNFINSPFDMFGLDGVSPASYIFVAFQMTFAAITVALISGAIADRVKLSSWIVFTVVWITLCYVVVAHNVWGGGWWATKFPALDYAGGTVVHINAGIAGLVLAVIVGKRKGFMKEPMKPHNLTMTMLGAGLLWFGWYGFNVGSIVDCAWATTCDPNGEWYATQYISEMSTTFLTTTLATMAACLAWLLVERIVHGKASALGAASGIVAGLVAITPACGSVDVYGALAVGVVAGALCALAVSLKFKLKLDDSLDVVGVHLVGGITGALMIGLVGTLDSPQGLDGFFPEGGGGLFYGGDLTLLGHQFMAVLFTLVWTGVLTTVIGLAIKYTLGWRIPEEAEVDGIDADQHGETAYDIATGSGVLA
ncbi:ammonium transporter [Nocardioides humilatus]|nr:ammonium transporter [Nocardioides humilatus]